MALYFKSSLSWQQVLGMFVIISGMVLITFGGKETT
jgi:drug/metabolite transporter (DMT)-like permease